MGKFTANSLLAVFLFVSIATSVVVVGLNPYPVISNSNSNSMDQDSVLDILSCDGSHCIRRHCDQDFRLWRYGGCPQLPPTSPSSADTNLLNLLAQLMQKPSTGEWDSYRQQKSDQVELQPATFIQQPMKGVKENKAESSPSLIKIVKFPSISRQHTKTCIPDECGCPDELRFICGSDSVTYGNECLLECNKKCNPDLKYSHEGYCGRIFFPDTTDQFVVSTQKP